MKFSSSLKFNALAEWWDYYISYSALKKQIFQLEKQYHDGESALHDLEAFNERSRLMTSETSGNGVPTKSADIIFSGLLDKELEKITEFYKEQEADIERDLETLEADIISKDEEGPSFGYSEYDDDEDDDDDDDEEDAKRRE
jgi:phosphate transporter